MSIRRESTLALTLSGARSSTVSVHPRLYECALGQFDEVDVVEDEVRLLRVVARHFDEVFDKSSELADLTAHDCARQRRRRAEDWGSLHGGSH